MRIIQVINHAGLDRGGAERLARGLHEDLLAMGQDARLIALEACDLAGLKSAQSLGFASPRDPRAAFALRRALRSALRPGDVVHAHLFPATACIAGLRTLGRVPATWTMTEHNTWNRRRDRALGRFLDRGIYGGFDRVVGISAQTETALLEAQPACRGRTLVIENGTRLLFDHMPQRSPHPNPPVILSAGRLVRQKNYPMALQALAVLRNRPWTYLIAGAGADEHALRQQTHALGLEDRVRFLGHVEDLKPILASADLFLMPSLWEGFGLAAVEAMNAGLPVVASDVPGLREVVAPTGGALVSPEDPQALATAIRRMLDDPEARARSGRLGHAEAWRYGRDRMARAYLAMWQGLVMKNGAH